jgi:hypothetical protein
MTHIEDETSTDIITALIENGFEGAVPQVMTVLLNQESHMNAQAHISKIYRKAEIAQDIKGIWQSPDLRSAQAPSQII